MVLVSYSGREINAKLVYYGPGLSGKTTNLEAIYGAIPQSHRGKMVSMKTKTERTLFFDFLPIQLGELAGFKTRFLLYTVPGQVYYNATRKLVLKGVDAIVFVADSKRGKMDENVESLQNLRDNLKEHGLELDRIPWVIQYNKRDMPDTYSVEELDRVLNPQQKVPSFEAVATTGQGVIETFKAISRLLLKHLSHEIGVRVVGAGEEPKAHGPVPDDRAMTAAQTCDEPHQPAPAPPAPEPLPTPEPAIRSSAASYSPLEGAASGFEVERFGPSTRTSAYVGGAGGEQRTEGVGSRLRRWFARTPEQDPSLLSIDLHAGEAETPVETHEGFRREGLSAPRAVTQESPDPAPVADVPKPSGPTTAEVYVLPRAAAAPAEPTEEHPVEIPLEVDLDPADLARGIVLKVSLRLTASPETRVPGADRRHAA